MSLVNFFNYDDKYLRDATRRAKDKHPNLFSESIINNDDVKRFIGLTPEEVNKPDRCLLEKNIKNYLNKLSSL